MTFIACDIHFQICLVCRIFDTDTIVGFCTYYSEQGIGRIGWLGVAQDFHRRGVGTALIETLATELSEKGVREVLVSTLGETVDYPPYAKTRAFYRAVGFRDLRRVAHPDNPECSEELLLKLDLALRRT
jgi:ribosomal protein S18 acetylase RimI-like enzyme